MSISKEHRDDLVNYWLEKAEESIQSASSEIGNDREYFRNCKKAKAQINS